MEEEELSPEYLRRQAEQCRAMARSARHPAAMVKLQDLARDYDAQAAALEAGGGEEVSPPER